MNSLRNFSSLNQLICYSPNIFSFKRLFDQNRVFDFLQSFKGVTMDKGREDDNWKSKTKLPDLFGECGFFQSKFIQIKNHAMDFGFFHHFQGFVSLTNNLNTIKLISLQFSANLL